MATNFGLPNWRRFASDAGGYTGQGGLYDPELEQQIASQGPPPPVQPLMMQPQLPPPPPSPQEQALDARRQGIPQAPQARVPVQAAPPAPSPVIANAGPELAGPGPGQGVHLPPGPRGLSLPPDPTANDRGFDPDQMTLQAARNAVTGMMPQPLSAETIRLAQQPVSTKRAILAGLASTFTPTQAFAPMIAYGTKGLQARKQMAEYQAAQPGVLTGIESLASTQHTMGQTANEAGKNQAEIGRIGAETGSANALTRTRNSEVTVVTGSRAAAMGVPDGAEVPTAQVVEWEKSQATLNAPPKPSGDRMKITPELAKALPNIGLTPGQDVSATVFNNLVDAIPLMKNNPSFHIVNDKGEVSLFDSVDGHLIKALGKVGGTKSIPQTSITVAGSEGLNNKDRDVFNLLIKNAEASPLIKGADLALGLQNTIKEAKANPGNGAVQLNLMYGYVKALDTYQSAVREGEIGLVRSLDSKIGSLKNYVQQIQNGQTVRPEIAIQLADAASLLVDSINAGAQRKSLQFESQAQQNGTAVYNAWKNYRQAAQAAYDSPSPAGAPASGGAPGVGTHFNGSKVLKVEKISGK